LSDLTLILLAAGESSRFSMDVKKQWLRIGHDPLWRFVAKRFYATGLFEQIVITSHAEDSAFMQKMCDFTIVQGGKTRQQSLQNALSHVTSEYVLVSDIARACITEEMLQRILAKKGKADCIVPILPIHDTVVYNNDTINRESTLRIQTPQLSLTTMLKQSLDTKMEYTDESSAIVALGGSRLFVDGDDAAAKLTFTKDAKNLHCLQAPSTATLLGNGFDVHAFDTTGEMFLCGVKIENEFGFKAHSDGDVAIHALIDALLGAAGLGDIGALFPDSDAAYADIRSTLLLEKVVKKLYDFGFVINNIDLTIIAQKPRLEHYKDAMRSTIAKTIQIDRPRVNIKATTTEHLGFIGRKEGVGVFATASLGYFDWMQQ
jgi:2-C-methyl-D-erythritol 4-phosphate cytidylyltransferase / 2-C-methyl-D-erythritol 2,4-cyclodiphosphate synthase